MTVKVTLDLDRPALKRVLEDEDGPIAEQLDTLGPRLLDYARQEVPRRSGELADSTYAVVRTKPLRLEVGASAEHALFVHGGTGLFGPRRRVIEAKPGKVFVFTGSDGRTVFTRRIKGQKPNPFLTRALRRLT